MTERDERLWIYSHGTKTAYEVISAAPPPPLDDDYYYVVKSRDGTMNMFTTTGKWDLVTASELAVMRLKGLVKDIHNADR